MSKQFTDGFCANVNTATMKTKKLNGKTYLVGPLIMARQIVMNGIFYPAKELSVSTIHWNNCPAVENHPKDAEGKYVSANSPEVLEKDALGLIFNTTFNSDTTKLHAECWIDTSLLKKHPKVNEVIKEGGMLEVSTGLFLDAEEKTGTYEGRDYTRIAHNFKPDHLAILTEGVGAMSIADGAGFPRANERVLECNELSGGDKMTLLGKAVRKQFSDINGGSYAYLCDVFDNYLVYDKWENSIEGYVLYSVNYSIGKDDQTVSFTMGTVKKVVRQVSYVDKTDPSVIQTQSHDGQTPKTNEGDTPMKREEQINKWLADKRIDANQVEMLKGLTDPQFTGMAALIEANAPNKPGVPKGAEDDGDDGDEGEDGGEGDAGDDGDGEGDEGDEPEGNQKPVTKQKKVVDANTDKDYNRWARNAYQKERAGLLTTIKGNKANTFTDAELGAMSIEGLQKVAALAGNTTDRSLQPTHKGKKPQAPAGNAASDGEVEYAPLVNPNQRRAKSAK